MDTLKNYLKANSSNLLLVGIPVITLGSYIFFLDFESYGRMILIG